MNIVTIVKDLIICFPFNLCVWNPFLIWTINLNIIFVFWLFFRILCSFTPFLFYCCCACWLFTLLHFPFSNSKSRSLCGTMWSWREKQGFVWFSSMWYQHELFPSSVHLFNTDSVIKDRLQSQFRKDYSTTGKGSQGGVGQQQTMMAGKYWFENKKMGKLEIGKLQNEDTLAQQITNIHIPRKVLVISRGINGECTSTSCWNGNKGRGQWGAGPTTIRQVSLNSRQGIDIL